MTSGRAVRQTTGPPARIASRFSSSRMAPPPTATTRPAPSSRASTARRTARRSHARNSASPWSAKIRAIDFPASRSTSASVSTNSRSSRAANRRPTALLPVPMKPAKTMVRTLIRVSEPAAAIVSGWRLRYTSHAFEGERTRSGSCGFHGKRRRPTGLKKKMTDRTILDQRLPVIPESCRTAREFCRGSSSSTTLPATDCGRVA